MSDQSAVLVDGEKLRDRFFDFRIGQTAGDILGYDPVQGQKVVKLSEGPDPGFCNVNGRDFVIGGELDQVFVLNPFDRSDSI